MDGVGQQCHRSRDGHHRQLREGGRAECHQADLDRPDALGAGLQGVVEGVSGVVGVGAQQVGEAAAQTAVLAVVVIAVVVVVVARLVVLVAVAGILGSHFAPPRGVARRGVA